MHEGDREPRQLLRRVLLHDASLIDERLNLWSAWLSILPGNYRHGHRYHYLMNVNYADMALFWASYTGEKRNKHLSDEYLCTFETADQQLFYFNGHVGGVTGIQILGAQEAGKSFVTNYVTGQAQKYKPVTMILDIGHSYQDLTGEFGGSHFEISLKHQDAQINPFSLPSTVDNMQFLFYFARLLLARMRAHRQKKRRRKTSTSTKRWRRSMVSIAKIGDCGI